MSRLAPEFPVNETRGPRPETGYERRGGPYYPEHRYRRGSFSERPLLRRPRSGMMIAGILALGLGALAFYYLGPDLRRYIKIEMM